MDAGTLDIIQCIAIVVVGYCAYKGGVQDGFHRGTLATLNYLESEGIVKFEETQKEPQ